MTKKNGTKKATIGVVVAGAVAAALFYFMGKRGEPPPPPTYICPYCGETFATYEELQAHIQTQHPYKPPVVDYGRLWGYIKDTVTGGRIVGARVYLDDILQDIADTNGMYGTDYVLFGSHTLTVEANNYKTKAITVDIQQESTKLEILLDRLPSVPTEWTEGVQIESIEAIPLSLYLGNSVEIRVYIHYPAPLLLPATIHGTVTIDGDTLTRDWEIDSRTSLCKFTYTPTHIGSFTAVALDKSAHFTVLQDIADTYYSPFGGVRMPLCTDIVVPDVAPFTEFCGHPGGDFIWSSCPNTILIGPPVWGTFYPVSKFNTSVLQIIKKLSLAYPRAWNPSDAVVSDWGGYFSSLLFSASLLIIAVDYSCKPYWDSKEELVKMIAGSTLGISTPNEWKIQYGTTCPTCNGTGQIYNKKCSKCDGLGKILRVDLIRGLRDWVKTPTSYTVTYYNYTYTSYIWCPYCDTRLTTGTYDTNPGEEGRLNAARFLINHIETKHPNHPLTEPAWF